MLTICFVEIIIEYSVETSFLFAAALILLLLALILCYLKSFLVQNVGNDENTCLDIARQKFEFLEILKKEFTPTTAKGLNNFDWEHLERYYNDNSKGLRDRLFLMRLFCEFSFNLFSDFNCEDDKFMKKIISVYHQVMDKYVGLIICGQCEIQKHPEHFISEESSFKEVPLSEKEINEKYRFTNRCLYYELIHFYSRPAMEYFAFLRFCVKFGLNCSPHGADILPLARKQMEILYDAYCTLHIGQQVLCEKSQSVESALETPHLRRTMLTATALQISFCEYYFEGWTLHCLLPCLRLDDFNYHTMTLPEAAISRNDVENFLRTAYHNDEHFIQQALLSFQTTFPNAPRFPTPRSLKHLSLYKVRDCIQKSPSIIAALSQIQIPASLKEDLLFD